MFEKKEGTCLDAIGFHKVLNNAKIKDQWKCWYYIGSKRCSVSCVFIACLKNKKMFRFHWFSLSFEQRRNGCFLLWNSNNSSTIAEMQKKKMLCDERFRIPTKLTLRKHGLGCEHQTIASPLRTRKRNKKTWWVNVKRNQANRPLFQQTNVTNVLFSKPDNSNNTNATEYSNHSTVVFRQRQTIQPHLPK